MTCLQIDTGVGGRIAPYSDAIVLEGRHRRLVTSGTPGFDSAGQLADDFSTQAEYAWRNIMAALQKAGMGAQDIVRLTHYLVRREDLPAYRAICPRFLGGARPTSMLMFVGGFAWPDMLLEITVEAEQPIS